jgi:predicted Zn finger-like uncharacterized protein
MNNTCPSCGAVYNVAAKDIGRRIKCKKCQTALVVTENGLETDQPAASPPPPVASAAPAFDDVVADDDDGEEVVSTKKGKKDRGRRYSGVPGPSLGERLAPVGGLPTIIMGFGAFLVVVFLFMPIIGQAAVARAQANVDRLEQRRAAKLKQMAKDKKSAEEIQKSNEEFDKEKEGLNEDVTSETTGNKRARWMEMYGMMFGFLFVMVGSLMFMMPDQPTIRRVVGAIVLTAQLVLVFISFIIRGAVVG